MWPHWVSNPGPLTYESGALHTALRGPAIYLIYYVARLIPSVKIHLASHENKQKVTKWMDDGQSDHRSTETSSLSELKLNASVPWLKRYMYCTISIASNTTGMALNC